MLVYKIKLKTTNALEKTAYSEKNKQYIDVIDGYIYVTQSDLKYVMENFKFISIEEVGYIYERPCEK